ncbi:hypothetical protein GCM10011352_04980 [Marinobacterium zhoushanense]|uniref:DUF945 domain-containing protein n=1 Tax=Marinobacterium zhoushanense TaxID=1679163 RepID=A0ABQ1K3L0_9GAMM|nr:DUF932 domain-containing protein [Marinobacterium zhoushanense]GGB82172.1 hypothetical protein GCM10011352_04980 [Marinobacterium zhoushanense]
MTMHILSHDQLRRQAPAIFATAPDQAVSDRYGFVPTIEVVNALQSEGWHPVRAQQTLARTQERRAVSRHMVRFRQEPDRQIKVGDSVAELVLTNSHDRTSAYQLDLGLFRLVCSNGMVTPVGEMGGIRVRHGRQVVTEILEGSIALIDEAPEVATAVDRFRSLRLSPDEAQLFAQSALTLRYGEDWINVSPVTPEAVLQARRSEDREVDLWHVFNRTQENLLKGGIRGRSTNGRNTRTRPIRSVSEDVRLNRALWQLTEHFAALKSKSIAA